MILRKLRERLIKVLGEPDTVYIGRGSYQWVLDQGNIIIRKSTRMVSLGPPTTLNWTDWQECVRAQQVVMSWDYWEGVLKTEGRDGVKALIDEKVRLTVKDFPNDDLLNIGRIMGIMKERNEATVL